MTTYNAKDLIEQAQMLADLQNSDFISWKENMMFLDNAWADLYQQIINHGDKSFLKTFSFEGERCELPRDFYQLQYICYNDGLNEVPINRKAKTSLTGGPFYDLVEDEIVIYNRMNNLRKVVVYYYPVRDSITYAADDQKVDGIDGTIIDGIDGTIIDVCDKKVYYQKNNTYYIKDIINGTETSDFGGFMLTDSGIVSLSKPCFKFDNKCYYTDWSNGELSLKKQNGTVIHKTTVAENPNFPTRKINGLSDGGLFYVVNGVLKRFDLETGEVEDIAEGLISDKVYCFKTDVYWETDNGIMVNGEVLIPATDYDTYHGVMKEDEKTGYGILVDNFVIKSVYENTQLLFPNNVYYNYLAYKLAAYYKIKQGADPNGIAALGANALEVFYDTILKDTNDFVRISNVYAR